MTRTIIGLNGQPNSGKSTTIKVAFEKLAQLGKCIYSYTRVDKKELKEILEIDGVYVGFASAGDMPDRLERSLQFLIAYGCEAIVCAARLNKSVEPLHLTIDAVKHFAEANNCHIVWISKLREPDVDAWDAANIKAAKRIIAEVYDAVKRLRPVET